MPVNVAPPPEGVAELADRFAGCLVGLAIGDALGMPFEGMDAEAVFAGRSQVTEFLPGHGLSAGQYTDDTKMMLCIAESMLENGWVQPEDVARRFVAWFDTGDLRGIGTTCLEAILNLKSGVCWRESGHRGQWAAGNGTAMRIAPVALLDWQDMERLRADCWSSSIITHHNPEAVAGATAVAYAIARVVTGDLDGAALLADAAEFVGSSGVARNLVQAQRLLLDGTPAGVALETLGTGGYVVETVPSAMYCFLWTPRDFVTTVSSAILGGGDADTTGAVAGAISGAYNGLHHLPPDLVSQVEDSQRLQDLGRAIFGMAGAHRER
jgi:ADP-ribosyl-[dinitrogen reductase] hydrolase